MKCDIVMFVHIYKCLAHRYIIYVSKMSIHNYSLGIEHQYINYILYT